MGAEPMFPAGAVLIFGATGGIGAAVARVFANAGSDVAIVWRSKEDAAKALATEIDAAGRKASLHRCDVTDEGALAAAAATRSRRTAASTRWSGAPGRLSRRFR